MNIREEIGGSFKKIGVSLKQDSSNTGYYAMPASVTNQFMGVEDTQGRRYLVRINGNLWPPFTRDGEHHNLDKLKEKKIPTGVIINNTLSGFQICNCYEEDQRFSNLSPSKQMTSLKSIATTIRQVHQVGEFQNQYCIFRTIGSSLKRLDAASQNQLFPFYEISLRFLVTLSADKENYVASHNDLLPSSIYVNKNCISIVDWEYSAMNHCSYDLSLFSIKSSLTLEQEKVLLESYDNSQIEYLAYSVKMMKPVVNFLLLLWHTTSKNPDLTTTNILLAKLTTSLADVVNSQSMRMLTADLRFGFFGKKTPKKMTIPMRSVELIEERLIIGNNYY